MLPPTAEDQTPGALLLLAVGFGMAALLLKVSHKQTCPRLPTHISPLQRHQMFMITSAKTNQLMLACVCVCAG